MKYILVAITNLFLFAHCKQAQTCSCTETYTGGENEYALVSDSTLQGQSKKDAAAICNKGDIAKKPIAGGEYYTKECELK